MKTIENVTLGCDPEIFLLDGQQGGKLIASCDKIGGSKDAPLQITGLARGFAVQEDNVALEFCIPPATTSAEFVQSVTTALNAIEHCYVQPIGLTYAFGVSSHLFDPDQLTTEKALQFGCDPDFNIYTGYENPKPSAGDSLGADGYRLRTAGGHVHFGWENPTDEQRIAVIRAADIVLGTASVFLDGDSRRALLYGKAGAFRPKAYGAEYRTLSNFWLGNHALISWVSEAAMQVVEVANKHHELLLDDSFELLEMAESAINRRSTKLAGAVRKYFQLESGDSLFRLVA